MTLELVSFSGPSGAVSPDRVLARTEASGNAFVPLTQPVCVITGDLRAPDRTATIELLFKAGWQDAPGLYEGLFAVSPAPQAAKNFGSRPGRVDSPALGERCEIHARYKVEEMIQISLQGGEVHFDVNSGPGVYWSQPDLPFTLTTSARQWSITCQASDLIGEGGIIAGARLNWLLLNEIGQTVSQGNLGSGAVILSGVGIPMCNNYTLRFNIEITLDDPAGDYHGTISLTGMTGS